MGSKWFTGGVVAASRGRIQFDFILDGVRYRPTIKRPPSEANLRRARERLEVIKHQIELGIFSFEEEFPNYRFLKRLGGTSKARLCADVFDDYISHCEARRRREDMAAATVSSYRKVLNGIWRPKIGHLVFSQVRYSHLVAIADGQAWSKKTYNNVIAFSNAPLISVIETARPRRTQLNVSVVRVCGKTSARKSTPFPFTTPRH